METVDLLLKEKGRDVVSASPEASALELARLMNERYIGAVLVVEKGAVIGIVTERDLLTKVVAQGRNASEVKVAEIMSKDVVFVEPGTPIKEAMAIMTELRHRHLPVVCPKEGICGIISIGDCNRWHSKNQEYTLLHLTDYIQGKYK